MKTNEKNSLLHFDDFFTARRDERLKMTMSKVVETVSKKKIPSHVRSLVFEICCDDENGEDVEVPFVQYRLPRSTKWTHQLFEYSVIHQHQQPTKISCDLKKNLSSSTLNYSTIILIPCALSMTTMPTYFFFSFGVLFKCIPWHTAKILFESLVHCEYKNTKPNIEIKQIKEKKKLIFLFLQNFFQICGKNWGKLYIKNQFPVSFMNAGLRFPLRMGPELYKITEDERFSTVYVSHSFKQRHEIDSHFTCWIFLSYLH